MTITGSTHTTKAYWPRAGINGAINRSVRLDIVYNVWSSKEPSDIPDDQRLNLVFVPGVQLVKETWNYYVELSFAKWGKKLDKVITIDPVNAGDSALLNHEKTTWFSSWADVGRDIGMVVQDVSRRGQLSGPVILLGHSMGGAASLFAANFDTELYAGVVLFDPVGSGIDPTNVEPFNKFLGYLGSRAFKYAQDEWNSQEEYETFLNKFLSRNFHPRIKRDTEHYQVYKGRDNKIHAKSTRALQAGGYLSAASTDRAGGSIFKYTPLPVLVVRGDVEDWNPEGQMEEIVNEVLPKASLAIVEGGGHLIAFEQPDAIFAAISGFIDEQFNREVEFRQQWTRKLPATNSFNIGHFEDEVKLLEKGVRSKTTKL